MTRQARIVLPGVMHHVTQRGNNRQDIFFNEGDRRLYLSFLYDSAIKYSLKIWAYCLMNNHIHLIVTPEIEDALAKAIGRTHLMYAQYMHRTLNHIGHFWQNRFYSCPMDESHFITAVAYVELNPYRAGIVQAPWDYAWSSARAHCGFRVEQPTFLAIDEWFVKMPVEEWKATLREIARSKSAYECIRRHTRTGRFLGDDAFLDSARKSLGQR